MYFALTMGGLVATIASLAESFAKRRLPRFAARADLALGTFIVATLPLALVLRDGVQVYFYARATGGRFNEGGRRIESNGEAIAALRWFVSQPFAPPPRGEVGLHASMHASWSEGWALGGRTTDFNAQPPKEGSDAITIADVRFVPDGTRRSWFHTYAVTAIGPVWILRSSADPPRAMAVVETEPGALERYFVSGTEPHRTIEPDAYGTWELLAHLGDPPPLPESPPQTREEHRIRYNVAMAASDRAAMRVERDAMALGCAPLDATFSDYTHLFATCFTDGVAPKLTLLFEASGPLAEGVELSVMSRVVEAPQFSTTMADPVVRQSGFPFALPPTSFKKGFVYAQTVWIQHRPGVEVFTAVFSGNDAPRIPAPVEVLRL
jgi:hypothetical protein